MRSHPRLAVVGLAALIMAGCFGGPAASPSSPPAATASAPQSTAQATPAASEPASPAPTAEPVASDDLGPFSCDLPLVEDTPPARAQLADVRVGTHPGYDRVVFEFSNALPEISMERAEPPFRHDVTGEPIVVEGSSFLRLSLAGGTKETEEHTSSYAGPTDFDPGFPMLVDLVEGGDFEAHSTWYLGLNAPACSRVTLLNAEGSHRLVIDVES